MYNKEIARLVEMASKQMDDVYSTLMRIEHVLYDLDLNGTPRHSSFSYYAEGVDDTFNEALNTIRDLYFTDEEEEELFDNVES